MKKLVGLIFMFIFFFGCSSEYDKSMKIVYDIKRRDKNPNPIYDGEVEPSIPDKSENDKTVLGIDSNHNGIRDDVDIWINRTARSSNERRAMRQFAREQQQWLKIGINPTRKEVDDVAANEDYAGGCLQFFSTIERGKNNNVDGRILELYDNTELRLTLDRNNQFSYGGGPIRYSYNETYKYCKFPIYDLNTEIVKFNLKTMRK
ncbi:MAG: hypothetical protein ACXVCE_09525 [Bacteriovorax sp.]